MGRQDDGAAVTNPRLCRRFWRKVRKLGGDRCWIWTGARDQHGYAVVALPVGERRYRNRMARRVAYELLRGPLPPGVLLLSSCGVRRCVNPDHHFLGNDTELAAESLHRWASRTVSTSARCEIWRMRVRRRATTLQLAHRFGLTVRQVRRARSG